MTLKQRADAFAKVGSFVQRHFSGSRLEKEQGLHQGLEQLAVTAGIYNNWFILKYVNEAIQNIGAMLCGADLVAFGKEFKDQPGKTIAVICAGNIPLVGFHDVFCVLLSGNRLLLKMSADDNVLMPFFLKLLTHYEPGFESQVTFASGRLSGFDAIIATGSNNTAAHFEYYFGRYPRIIRKSRTSVAVLNGNESPELLRELGRDVFTYFGLGCRNVSKLLVPEGYNFATFFESQMDYAEVVNNKKYGNNYDYYRAIYLLEKQAFLDNNFLMLKEETGLFSPVGTLFYQQFKNKDEILQYIEQNKSEIQCVVGEGFIPFGYSQQPVITDFADNVNTVSFLVTL